MISNCQTTDITMLMWMAYMKSLNLDIRHIVRTENTVVDMPSRARFKNKNEMKLFDEEDDNLDFFSSNSELTCSCGVEVCATFFGSEYEGEMLQTGKYLSTHEKDEACPKNLFGKIRKKSLQMFPL